MVKPNMGKVLFAVALVLSLSLSLPVAAAGTPSIFSYQGRLTDASGNLLGGSGTAYYFKFSIWDNATVGSGTKLWPSADPTSYSITVRQGVFNANIGDTANGYPDALNYDFAVDQDIFLQVEVSTNNITFQTLTPRQRISSSIFAELAGAVSGVGQSSFGTTTAASNTIVTIQSTTTTSIGALIRASVGQIADLFQIKDSAGASLFVVNGSGSVGVGKAAPSRKLDVLDVNSVPQMRLSQTGSVYGEFYVDSAGDVQLSSTGGNFRLQNENLWVCSGGSCGATAPVSQGNIIVETAVIFNNNFKLKQIDASTTVMYDSADNPILEFDEAQ